MDGLIRSKVARNIDQGNSVLGLGAMDLAVVFLAFQTTEWVFGLVAGSILAALSYAALFYLRHRQAEGFLMHAGRFVAESRIFTAYAGLNEKGEHQ